MQSKLQEVLNALSAHRADDYQTWLEVGMAIHSAGGTWGMWDAWSKKSPKYKAGECEKKWATFANYTGAPISIGSLIKMAKEDGWNPRQGFGFDDATSSDASLRSTSNNPNTSKVSNASKTSKTPNSELRDFISAVFKPNDIINYNIDSLEKDGKWLPYGKGICKSYERLMSELDKFDDIGFVLGDWKPLAGAWIRSNPVLPETSGSKNADVADFRHCLIESDSLPKELQLLKILELNLPCSAIVDSGGKSIHAIVKIDAGNDEALYRERVQKLHKFLEEHGFPVDKACKNASRLSRIAGVSRNGIRQELIAVNVGSPRYTDWEIVSSLPNFKLMSAKELRAILEGDTSDVLLGLRFLCRGGAWLLVAQSGIGKSVLAMQMALNFTLGKPVFGIDPHCPRKVLLIQAENNDIDLSEPFHSITKKLNFTVMENETIDEKLYFLSEDSSSGAKFVELLDAVCTEAKPDIVIIDPLLSYVGGDISRQEVCSDFLRNKLNPVVHKHNFGLIIMHHTGKPPKDKSILNVSDMAYMGIGSSELTNWARAVSVVVQNKDDNNVYEFIHTKRGHRSGAEVKTYIKHSTDGICWEMANEPAKTVKDEKNPRTSKYDKLRLENLSPCSKEQLFSEIAKRLSRCGEPASSKDVLKVFNAVRQLNHSPIIFTKENELWQGRLYVSESPNTTDNTGGMA